MRVPRTERPDERERLAEQAHGLVEITRPVALPEETAASSMYCPSALVTLRIALRRASAVPSTTSSTVPSGMFCT